MSVRFKQLHTLSGSDVKFTSIIKRYFNVCYYLFLLEVVLPCFHYIPRGKSPPNNESSSAAAVTGVFESLCLDPLVEVAVVLPLPPPPPPAIFTTDTSGTECSPITNEHIEQTSFLMVGEAFPATNISV